ncbi:MAG TPA: DUF2946 family protein [Pseudolabrys sp.]|nr:DUF2946 family protein [Pseudolabrys sp.]
MKADRAGKHKSGAISGIYRVPGHLYAGDERWTLRIGLKRAGGSRVLTWIAIYAVALHVVLLGLIPPVTAGQGAGFDPLSSICHSQPAGQTQEGSDNPDFVPGHACEHCNLCAAYAPPMAPPDVQAARLAPTRILDVLRPISATVQTSTVADLRLARGPPLNV